MQRPSCCTFLQRCWDPNHSTSSPLCNYRASAFQRHAVAARRKWWRQWRACDGRWLLCAADQPDRHDAGNCTDGTGSTIQHMLIMAHPTPAAAPPPAALPPQLWPPAGSGTPPCVPASARGCRPRCSSAPQRSRRSGAGRGWRRSRGRRRRAGGLGGCWARRLRQAARLPAGPAPSCRQAGIDLCQQACT